MSTGNAYNLGMLRTSHTVANVQNRLNWLFNSLSGITLSPLQVKLSGIGQSKIIK